MLPDQSCASASAKTGGAEAAGVAGGVEGASWLGSDEAVPAADESEIVSVEEFAAPFELARTEGNKSEALWKLDRLHIME